MIGVSADMEPDHDVRQLDARLRRTVFAIALGFPVAFQIALLLPTRHHFPGFCFRTGHFVEGGDPVVMFAGCVAMSLAFYALLGARHRSRRATEAIPHARARRRASNRA
jgi:hypothetical protein